MRFRKSSARLLPFSKVYRAVRVNWGLGAWPMRQWVSNVISETYFSEITLIRKIVFFFSKLPFTKSAMRISHSYRGIELFFVPSNNVVYNGWSCSFLNQRSRVWVPNILSLKNIATDKQGENDQTHPWYSLLNFFKKLQKVWLRRWLRKVHAKNRKVWQVRNWRRNGR